MLVTIIEIASVYKTVECFSWSDAANGLLIESVPVAMKMRCYCKILHISYKDHVTNKEVCAKVQNAIRPHTDLQTVAKRHKLQWYGHVSRSLGLAIKPSCKAQ